MRKMENDPQPCLFNKPDSVLFLQMTFQQICKDVHMVKTNGQQMFIESRNRPLPRKNNSTGKIKGQLHSIVELVKEACLLQRSKV